MFPQAISALYIINCAPGSDAPRNTHPSMNAFEIHMFYYWKHKFNMDQTPLPPLLWFFVMPTRWRRWTRCQPLSAERSQLCKWSASDSTSNKRQQKKVDKLIRTHWLAATSAIDLQEKKKQLTPRWRQNFFLHIFSGKGDFWREFVIGSNL